MEGSICKTSSNSPSGTGFSGCGSKAWLLNKRSHVFLYKRLEKPFAVTFSVALNHLFSPAQTADIELDTFAICTQTAKGLAAGVPVVAAMMGLADCFVRPCPSPPPRCLPCPPPGARCAVQPRA
jgi:hypothetical protein